MTAGENSTKWSGLQLFAAATIGLGWIAAIIMLLSTEGPPTSTWLLLCASSISVFASRVQRTSPRVSTTLVLVAAAVAMVAVVAVRNQ